MSARPERLDPIIPGPSGKNNGLKNFQCKYAGYSHVGGRIMRQRQYLAKCTGLNVTYPTSLLSYKFLSTTSTMIVARRAISRLGAPQLARGLSSRASTILSSLDISTTDEISGVYDGQWRGSGEIVSSICPTTGETLARVKTASPQELHDAIGRAREAYTVFRREYR